MTARRLSVVAGALLAVVATVAVSPAAPAHARVAGPRAPASPAAGASADADPNTLLVRFRPEVSIARARRGLALRGGTLSGAVGKTGYVAVRAPGRAAALRRLLAADPSVAEVEPNYLRRALVAPDDPRWKRQRDYLSLVRLPQAWEISRGSPTIDVAVVDTGVDLDTPDLAGRIAPGYNTFTRGATPPQDDHGHGTMVAGVAAAITGNNLGIAGAAWTARIIPVKALDARGWGDDAHVIAGIQWAADHGAEIINLSLGNPAPSAALHAAVQYARQRGALVVAAAGNSGIEAPTYPAAYPEVLAVAATDKDGDLANFSTRGPWVDVAAPGRRIVSTTLAVDEPNEEAYDTESGTSFAAPLAAGVAVLVRARYPSWTADQVADRLRRTARDAGRPGMDTDFGAGIIDAAAALGAAPEAARVSLAAPTLTIRAPNVVGYPAPAIVTARLLRAGTTTPVTGQPVAFYTRRRGTTAWTLLGRATTGSTGAAGIRHWPDRMTEYTARYYGPAMPGSVSGTVATAVRPRLTVTAPRSVLLRGTVAALSGAVTPAHRGQPVQLQQRYLGAWHTVASSALSPSSGYTFTVRLPRRATYYYRVVKPADADHATTATGAVTLRAG